MKLIINADDFGLSRGVNYGIVDAHILGVLTSTTLMITMPAVDHAIHLAKEVPNLGIGLHLNMTLGKPLTSCRTLIKSNGEFYKPNEKPDESIFHEDEIYQEFKAQYQLFLTKVGRKPTHLDSHLYAHQRYEKAKHAVLKLAEEMAIPVRDLDTTYPKVKFLDWFKAKNGFDTDLEKELPKRFLEMKGEVVCELMVHPAYVDHFITTQSSYNESRNKELQVLISQEMKDLIKSHHIDLIHFGDLHPIS